jgi:hypothetical protein
MPRHRPPLLAVTVAVTVAAAAVAAVAGCTRKADPAAPCLRQWDVPIGTLATTTTDCRTFIGQTAPQPFDYWAVSAEVKRTVGARLEMSARISRPAADAESPVELAFRGGHFALSRSGFYFWESQGHWSGWQPTGMRIEGENKLAVHQDGQEIEGFINDALVGTFRLAAAPAPGKVGVFVKGRLGTPVKAQVREFQLRELP